MINIDFKTYGRLAGAFIKNNSQVILAASALAGVVSTAITSGKAHVKAMDLLREEFPEGGWKFTDALRLTWTCYLPAAISITATSAAIIGGTVLSERRYAAMAAAYTVSQDVLEKYEDRVKELTGKKGSDTRSAIARDVIEENLERPENKSVIITGDNVLISDSYSGRVFPSTITKVQKVLNQINSDLINGISSVSLMKPISASDWSRFRWVMSLVGPTAPLSRLNSPRRCSRMSLRLFSWHSSLLL